MKKHFLFFGFCFLIACTNNTSTSEKEESGGQEGVENSNAVLLQNTFPQFFDYLKKEDPHFKEEDVTLSGENKLSTAPARPLDKENMQAYKNLLIYNNDSSLAIDLYSYNYLITTKNGNTQLQSAEPDTEIGLIDFNKGTRKRIFFSGPSYAVWDGAWGAGNIILLAGAEVFETEKIAPYFLRINLSDSTVETFQYGDTLQVNMQQFIKSKTEKLL